MITYEFRDGCTCQRCSGERIKHAMDADNIGDFMSECLTFTVCPICGNKRCPHNSDHTLDCTNSNEPGQIGSIY